MKKDLDVLMQSHQIDALLITGPAQHNPAMYYMTGGAHLTHADLLKKRGADPLLFYNPMERDEAAQTGLPTKSFADYRFDELLKQANGNVLQATVSRYQRMLADQGITSGRVAIYGRVVVGGAYVIFSELQRRLGELNDSLLLEAMMTKDEAEVARIRRMGQITVEVVGQVADFLTHHQARQGFLAKPDGNPLIVGDVKNQINLWLAERGAENPEGTIFAIGRDAGVPHSSGAATDVLRLGQTIIFDIFPCEAGGGYFYDLTRTWCLVYATDEALALYESVLAVYHQIISELKTGAPFRDFQKRACDLFEAQGHPTIQSDPQTLEGYVHSLGHGVGLHIHERPSSGRTATEADCLFPGVVASIEPGLYYPERGHGLGPPRWNV